MPLKTPSGLCDSWTDDLQTCPSAGIGISTNVIYRHNGQPVQEHQMENTCIRFKGDDSAWLYGVFDGHDRNTVAEYASQKMSAELLLGQLNDSKTDDDVKHLLRQAFSSVERDYFTNIGDKLARRTELLLQIPENIYEAHQQFPELVNELDTIQQEISSGTSAVVALIHGDKLYVANVGDCRALACRVEEDGTLMVTELTNRHDTDNPDEILRLTQLGLSEKDIAHLNHTTRCLGDFPRKGGYKDIDFLKDANAEPVIAEAAVCGGLPLDGSYRFLILTTASVCKALENATGTTDANRDLAALVLKEFSTQSTINGVAQAVIDEISRRHYDAFVGDSGSTSGDRSSVCHKREDMTLLVRNFNQPMGQGGLSNPPSFVSSKGVSPSRSTIPEDTWTLGNTASSVWSTDGTLSDIYSLPLDEHGRVAAYVDFSEFYEAVKKLEDEAAEIQHKRNSGGPG